MGSSRTTLLTFLVYNSERNVQKVPHSYTDSVANVPNFCPFWFSWCFIFIFVVVVVYMTLTANLGTVTGILMMKRFLFSIRKPSTLSVTYVTRSYTLVLVWPSTVCRYVVILCSVCMYVI